MKEGQQTLDQELKALRIDPKLKDSQKLPVRRRRRPWLYLVIVSILVGGGLFAAVVLPRVSGREVTVMRVVPQTDAPEASSAAVLTAAGYIIARHKIQLSAKVMGKVAWIGVDKGDRVRKGQMLVKLEDQDYQALVSQARGALASAEEKLKELQNGSRPQEVSRGQADLSLAQANLENARVTLERTRQLVKDNVMTQQNLDDVQARYDVAKAQVESARKALDLLQLGPRLEQIDAQRAAVRNARASLDYAQTQLEATEIRAPVDGTVLERLVEKGEMVTTSFVGDRGAKSSVVSLADLNDLQVEIDVSQSDFNRLHMGQHASIVPEAYADRRYEGVLDEIAPEANRQKATVQVKVKVLTPDDHLRPEMNAKVTFLANETKFAAVAPSRIVVPRHAVIDRQGKQTVFVFRDGRAVARQVKLGAGDSVNVEVASGLAAGESLITSGLETLKDGSNVREKK
jgi:HlyD family secretion protein